MSEDLEKEAAEETVDDGRKASETGPLDPISALKDKAVKNLERIGFVCVQDIVDAFQDKDDTGCYTTAVELKTTYWDPVKREALWSRSKAVTLGAGVKIEKAGGYTTLILQFPTKEHPDLNRIWAILSEYGKESVQVSAESAEIPVMDISAVPMSLGGKFGMVATDPVFWCLQPSMPHEETCTQIRILYQPESVIFMRDDSFETDEVLAKVKSEMAAERLAKEAGIRKKMQDEEFKKEKDKELAEYLENEKVTKHTFVSSKK